MDDKKQRLRTDYGFFLTYRTRWSDNDQYGHVNNAIYYHLFDAVVNTYLIEQCGMDPMKSEHIGLVVSSFCEFFSPVAFPDVLDLGLRVTRLGTSSVTYEVGVFKSKASFQERNEVSDMVCAVGGYTHVFVESASRGSTPMSGVLRSNLMKLAKQTPAPAISKL
ncbi:thioesterase [Pisolithus orientalis]|uniref:thioesterase n=1 Tax=Pisolithus orientalis TaxID=936130 RepID=UPI002224C1C7|nr:thioesterase [Pisolithus orientalis]KAI6015246.1 thioesterase [Pisolithus orientalis]